MALEGRAVCLARSSAFPCCVCVLLLGVLDYLVNRESIDIHSTSWSCPSGRRRCDTLQAYCVILEGLRVRPLSKLRRYIVLCWVERTLLLLVHRTARFGGLQITWEPCCWYRHFKLGCP